VRRGRGRTLWPALAVLLVAAAGTVVAVVLSSTPESAESATIVATTSETSIPVETVPAATLTAPEPEQPPTTTTEPPATATQPPPPPPEPIEWPAGRDGWTIVLSSVPLAAGRPAALAKAREALAAGLEDVGVLDSSRYPSLTPGYFVVFAGVHRSQEAADRVLARAAGVYPAAYVRPVTR
jgi:hypothetical protein